MSQAACRTLRAVLVAAAGLLSSALWAEPSWVILDARKAEGVPELIRVEKEQKGSGLKGMILLQEADGKSQEVEESRILARIPGLPGGEAKIDREEAVRAINLLLEAKSKVPVLEKALQEQVEQWKALLDKIPNAEDPEALAKAEEVFTRAVSQAMPQPYDLKATYTLEQLETQSAALEKLKKEFPARTGEIQQLMDPWETEAKYLREGKKKFEGRWLSSEEWEREQGARETAAKEAFLNQTHFPDVSPALIGQGTILVALLAGAAGLFFGISFLFHGVLEMMRRRSWWKGAAWLVGGALVVALIGRATGMALATPEPWLAEERGDAKVLEEILWTTNGQKKPFPRQIRLLDADLNAWWAEKLHPGGLSVLEILVVGVESWKVQFAEGGLRLERKGRLLGRPLVMRHEMSLRRTEKGEEVYRVEGSLGKMPLPPTVALRSWSQWIKDVNRMAEFFSAPQGMRLERLEKGAAFFSAP